MAALSEFRASPRSPCPLEPITPASTKQSPATLTTNMRDLRLKTRSFRIAALLVMTSPSLVSFLRERYSTRMPQAFLWAVEAICGRASSPRSLYHLFVRYWPYPIPMMGGWRRAKLCGDWDNHVICESQIVALRPTM